MTREEASNILWWASKRHYPGDQMDITAEDIEAFDMAIPALRSPTPDPITGLVPCGCGGKAMIHECHNLSYVIYCDKCKIETNYQLTADTAKDAWNTAMGYKEQ